MTDASEMRRLFEGIADLPPARRDAAIEAMQVDDPTRARLRAMVEIDTDLPAEEDALPPDRRHPWPGDAVGAYRLVAPIGDGGMGSVWLAVSRSAPEVDVAVKFATPVTVTESEARARLEEERRVLARLDHPGIVPIVDAGETAAGVPFLVLRAIHGRTIDVFAREEGLDASGIVALFERVAEALQHAHVHGIVHRDVKPQNVLVSDDGTPVLIDFGAAKITEASDLAPSHLTVGSAPRTPAFASPAQARGDAATPADDVFGLGTTLRSVLQLALRDKAPDRRLASLLDRATRRDAARRVSTAGDLGAALGAWRRRRDVRAIRRRTRLRTAVATFLAIVVAGQMGDDQGGRVPAGHPGVGPLQSQLLEGLSGMPAREIPANARVLAGLAERLDSVDWGIAAAVAAADDGEASAARDIVGRAIERLGDASPLRQVELAQVCSRLGLPAPALHVVGRVDPELLGPAARAELRVLELVQLCRTGREIPRRALADAASEIERLSSRRSGFERSAAALATGPGLAPAGGDDDVVEGLFRLRLELGDPAAIERWLRAAPFSVWRDARESRPDLLEALLGLHLRLVAASAVAPMADERLAAVELALERDRPEGRRGFAVRAWAVARIARVHGALADDPRRARDLAEAGVVRVMASNAAPIDLVLRLRALGATATARLGSPESAAEELRDVAALGAEVLGATAPLVLRFQDAASRPATSEPWTWAPLVVETTALVDAIDNASRSRGARPWWAP